jgi:hypothetical protein
VFLSWAMIAIENVFDARQIPFSLAVASLEPSTNVMGHKGVQAALLEFDRTSC